MNKDKIRGMLLGIAVGDALGMPCEGWTPEQIKEAFGRITTYQSPARSGHKWHSGLTPGDTTDDTQLTLAVAKALIETKGSLDMDVMVKHHIQAYKEGTAGWGRNTKNALEHLVSGVHWSKSGQTETVPNASCGNGMPMKSAPLAICVPDLLTRRAQESMDWLAQYTGMTHPNSMSVSACLAQIFACHTCLLSSIDTFNAADIRYFINSIVRVSEVGKNYYLDTKNNDDITARFQLLYDVTPETPVEEIIEKFGKGHYYVYNSLPFTYAFFVRNPYTIDSLYDCASAGGDTDSNASMLGALLGALHGSTIFPKHLVDGLKGKQEILKTADQSADIAGG